MFSKTAFKKRAKFGYNWSFLHFIIWKKILWTLRVLYNKGMQINFLSSDSFFISLDMEIDLVKKNVECF